MSRSDFWWVLWGIFVAFSLQVLYDGLGEMPNYTNKFWWGLGIVGTTFIFLFTWGLSIKANSAFELKESERRKKTMGLLDKIKWINWVIIAVSIGLAIAAYVFPFTMTIFLSPEALKAVLEADATIVGLFGVLCVYFVTALDQKIDKMDDRLALQPSNWLNLEERKRKLVSYKKSSVRALFGSLLCLALSLIFFIMALGLQTIPNSTQTPESLNFAYSLTCVGSFLLIYGIVIILVIFLRTGDRT